MRSCPILDQTYDTWECVVVDDASDAAELREVQDIIAELGEPKITLLALDENVGQTCAFFAGFHLTAGEFVCPSRPRLS